MTRGWVEPILHGLCSESAPHGTKQYEYGSRVDLQVQLQIRERMADCSVDEGGVSSYMERPIQPQPRFRMRRQVAPLESQRRVLRRELIHQLMGSMGWGAS